MTVVLIISILLNIFFVVYLRWLLKKLMFLSENILGLLQSLGMFSKHVSSVYGLETFYGDETLKSLMDHAREVVREIQLYEDIYTLASEEEIGELFKDVETSEFEEEEEE